MRRLIQRGRCWVASGLLLAIGGCVSSQQLFDFTRTEFARVIADSVGRLFPVYVQATA